MTTIESAVVTRLRGAGCVFAEDEARLLISAAASPAELDTLVGRRVAGEPLEHVLGWVEFCGLRIDVDAGVFVPRQGSEFLVREAARVTDPAARVLDLCCGSGALGVALASLVKGIEVHAADNDPAAARCARGNLDPIGGRVYVGDLFGALPAALRGGIDTVLANVPYVPTDAIALLPPEAREYEPRSALEGGADGLGMLRRVARDAVAWLRPGGHLMIEINEAQAAAASAAFADGGLVVRVADSDEFYGSVIIGRRERRD